ncbi:AbrB/MazE/SpoVT family DNA-binding domain-containing protein [Bradyrhizobium genomosp. I (2014)]|uniref:AbrB/MazE/SpoVT family DNA-binding domain-containing protein n=1 Tax=Bradyrhizobium genomosp. I (2014) TaxID=2683269 RepID=UPI0012F8CC48|nr:AbrB/MazE/SpoVT family DNA-binding domain-containing protein [Bradyrhizobium sp. CCBAU 43298]
MKVFDWDDDLAVVLPQDLIDQLALKEGDEIEIVATGGSATTSEATDKGDGLRENPPR